MYTLQFFLFSARFLIQYSTMASSEQSGRNGPLKYIAYRNLLYKCGNVSELKISMTTQNPYRLFYTCKRGSCDFFAWGDPIYTSPHLLRIIDNEVNSQDTRFLAMDREMHNIKSQLKIVKDNKWLMSNMFFFIQFILIYFFIWNLFWYIDTGPCLLWTVFSLHVVVTMWRSIVEHSKALNFWLLCRGWQWIVLSIALL